MKRKASLSPCCSGEETEATESGRTSGERSEATPPRRRGLWIKQRCLEPPQKPGGNNITLQDLPRELVEHIIGFLSLREIVLLGATCHFLHQVCNSQRTWRSLYQRIQPHERGATDWRRQVILHYTKGMFFHHFSSHLRLCSVTVPPISPNGFQRFLTMDDNLYVLDYTGALFYLCGSIRSPTYTFVRGQWRTCLQCAPLCRDVKDFTCDLRSGTVYRRYLYVLTSRKVRHVEHGTTRCDCVDIYVPSSGNRIFTMTFHPSMKFKKMSLLGAERQRELLLLSETGKVYSVTINELSLDRPRSYTTQVTLRKMSSGAAPQPVNQVYGHQGSVLYITDAGTAFLEVHAPGIYRDIFGTLQGFDRHERQTPHSITLPSKVVLCSLGYNHMALVNEFGRIFMQGNNRYGQLGTGDKIDRGHPSQIPYLRNPNDIFCGLHHTLVLISSIDDVKEVHGCGCGALGRLPGWPSGSPTFVKLLLKIPVCARRISATRDCLYIMTSYDTAENLPYRERPGDEDRGDERDEAVLRAWEQCVDQLRRCTNVPETVAKTKDFISHITLPGYQKDCLWDALGMIQRVSELGATTTARR